MTINVALSTSEAIILGCDSLSSVTMPMVPGHAGNLAMKDGKPIRDDEGNLCFKGASVSRNVTNVFGGVRKMFPIYEHSDFHVAAVTSGMAILEDMTVAELGDKFRRECEPDLDAVEAVTALFQEFIRKRWECAVGYEEPTGRESVPPSYPPLEFLVAGFEPSGEGRVYRLDILNNTMELQYDGAPGIAWAGQANYVERLLMGLDGIAANAIHDATGMSIDDIKQHVVEHVRSGINFNVLPTQYAIDFVEMLVNTQAGMQRFEPGIATVGGRTHIGVLRRKTQFTMLNEPELIHKHTGFNHDD